MGCAALKIPTMVKRGASVPTIYVDDGVSITACLVALQDGGKKIGELAPTMEAIFSRSQLRGVLLRLIEDGVVTSTGMLKTFGGEMVATEGVTVYKKNQC